MPYYNRMRHRIEDVHHSTPEVLIPKLIRKHNSTTVVANIIGGTTAPSAVRHWLLSNGWQYVNGRWALVNPPAAESDPVIEASTTDA